MAILRRLRTAIMGVPTEELAAYPVVALAMTAAATFGALAGWIAAVYFGVVTVAVLVIVKREIRRRG